MIQINSVTKKFQKLVAVNDLDCTIPDGAVFGVVGSNGAGKSTLLRLIAGVYKANKGEIQIDGQSVYDNPEVKKKCVFLADTTYIKFSSNMDSMAKEYSTYYKDFSFKEFKGLAKHFDLDTKTPLHNFSKGMRRQAMVILALSCKCKYIILDETLDGLDPVMRDVVKKKLYNAVLEDKVTVIISSHSLRELEDFCDNMVMIHKGKLVFQNDIENMKTTLFKVQVAFKDDFDKTIFNKIDVLKFAKQGSVANLIVKGEEEDIIDELKVLNPMLLEAVPLTLEEFFTYELKERGYVPDDKDNDLTESEV